MTVMCKLDFFLLFLKVATLARNSKELTQQIWPEVKKFAIQNSSKENNEVLAVSRKHPPGNFANWGGIEQLTASGEMHFCIV